MTDETLRTIVTGMIAAVVSVFSPWLLARQLNAQALRLKAEDYARQDVVAERAAAANKQAAEVANVQVAKLDQIHSLVNSSMTAAMEKELLATELNLTLLEELAQATGKPPSSFAAERIVATKIQIAELKAKLADRLKQTTAAAVQLSVDMKKA